MSRDIHNFINFLDKRYLMYCTKPSRVNVGLQKKIIVKEKTW